MESCLDCIGNVFAVLDVKIVELQVLPQNRPFFGTGQRVDVLVGIKTGGGSCGVAVRMIVLRLELRGWVEL